MKRWQGVYTAIVTPFRKDGSVDDEQLARFIEFQVAGDVTGVIPGGTTGEGVTLTKSELLGLTESVLKVANGRLAVFGSAGGNATETVVQLARELNALGVDGIMSVVPFYNKPTQRGMVEHFTRVADAVDVPVLMYNVPGRTSANMLPPTVLQLAEHGNIGGVKEASGNVTQAMEIIQHRPDLFAVLSGEDALTLPMMALGGDGVVSVVSNEVPRLMTDLVRAALGNDWAAARTVHYRILRLMNFNFIETNPTPVKTALAMMGLVDEHFRSPMVPLDDKYRAPLRECLSELDLLP